MINEVPKNKLIEFETPHRKFREFPPQRVIVHCMAEYLEYEGEVIHAVDFLEKKKLSAHFLVNGGGTVFQCADPRTHVCWHAKGHNTDTIGIELLVSGVWTYGEFIQAIERGQSNWWTAAQFEQSFRLCKYLGREFNIGIDNFLRHSDVDPDRKKDVGKIFPWKSFKNSIRVGL